MCGPSSSSAGEAPQDTLITHFHQPLTVRQLARRAGIPRKRCEAQLSRLRKRSLVRCLTPKATASRVYTPTRPAPGFLAPGVDWNLYSWVSYRHRRAVLLAFNGVVQPAEIKRRLRFLDPALRMSFNNCREVVQALRDQGLVEPVSVRRYVHLRYRLTPSGRALQRAVRRGESR